MPAISNIRPLRPRKPDPCTAERAVTPPTTSDLGQRPDASASDRNAHELGLMHRIAKGDRAAFKVLRTFAAHHKSPPGSWALLTDAG
jgi:hypothetical protein